MTKQENELTQDLIAVLIKHNIFGFVGTCYMIQERRFLTMRLVAPGVDEAPFRELESKLDDLVNKEFTTMMESREEGMIKYDGRRL